MENVYYAAINQLLAEKEHDELSKEPYVRKLKNPAFWGHSEADNQKEFQECTAKFTSEVGDAIKLMKPGNETFKLDTAMMEKYGPTDT